MRLLTLLLLVFAFAATALGQDTPKKPDKKIDPAEEELLEKIRKLQPPEWTYSKLASESDLIVVAKAISTSEVQFDQAIAGEFKSVKCLSNKMRILSTLKGRASEEIEVLTIEWKPGGIVLTNHEFAEISTSLLLPSHITVVDNGKVIGYGDSKGKTYTIEPEYLLYLRRLSGQRFVPVTGQRFSGKCVRILND
jgi:hypothetical protein